MGRARDDIDQLFAAALDGERRSIGRLLSLVEGGGGPADEISALAHPLAGSAHIIGVTGPPGAGKSTLVGRLVDELIQRGRTPAVLAVDPSSPLTGGAILGDRIRIDNGGADTFVRSVATRGHSGGLALSVPGSLRVFDAAGFDPLIIETVGVGQVEIEVTAAADTTVVVANPGTGDAVQANKSGLLEVADLFVVNKSDHPGANDVRRDLELMLDLSHTTGQEKRSGRRPPICMMNSLSGDGVDGLVDEIEAHRDYLVATNRLADRRRERLRSEIRTRVMASVQASIDAAIADEFGSDILEKADRRTLSPSEAGQRLAARLVR